MANDETERNGTIRKDSSGDRHPEQGSEELLREKIAEIHEVAHATVSLTEYELEKKELDLDKAAEELQSAKQDRRQRWVFAYGIFGLIVLWLGGIYYVVLLAGRPDCSRLVLHHSVLITLLATTTLKVLGLMYVVAHYLFRSRQ